MIFKSRIELKFLAYHFRKKGENDEKANIYRIFEMK